VADKPSEQGEIEGDGEWSRGSGSENQVPGSCVMLSHGKSRLRPGKFEHRGLVKAQPARGGAGRVMEGVRQQGRRRLGVAARWGRDMGALPGDMAKHKLDKVSAVASHRKGYASPAYNFSVIWFGKDESYSWGGLGATQAGGAELA
jgi:hypothetical protein